MKEVQRQGWSPSLLVLCTAMLLWPVAALAAGDVQDVNQLKAELQAQRQRQAELEDKINQLEARQKLKERALDQKIEQATAPQEKKKSRRKKPRRKRSHPRHSAMGQPGGSVRRLPVSLRVHRRREQGPRPPPQPHSGPRGPECQGQRRMEPGLSAGDRRRSSGRGDPVSTNQTLGGSLGKKPFWLDLAYLDYHPQWAKGLDLQAGKIEFPFYRPGKNQLIWDHDLTPEGGALLYGLPLGEKTNINLSAGGFWVVERSAPAATRPCGACRATSSTRSASPPTSSAAPAGTGTAISRASRPCPRSGKRPRATSSATPTPAASSPASTTWSSCSPNWAPRSASCRWRSSATMS